MNKLYNIRYVAYGNLEPIKVCILYYKLLNLYIYK